MVNVVEDVETKKESLEFFNDSIENLRKFDLNRLGEIFKHNSLLSFKRDEIDRDFFFSDAGWIKYLTNIIKD